MGYVEPVIQEPGETSKDSYEQGAEEKETISIEMDMFQQVAFYEDAPPISRT